MKTVQCCPFEMQIHCNGVLCHSLKVVGHGYRPNSLEYFATFHALCSPKLACFVCCSDSSSPTGLGSWWCWIYLTSSRSWLNFFSCITSQPSWWVAFTSNASVPNSFDNTSGQQDWIVRQDSRFQICRSNWVVSDRQEPVLLTEIVCLHPRIP